MIDPHGLVKICGRNPSTLTITAAEGPYAKPATRQMMPDGSYLSHGAAGMSGNSRKLTAIASATNSAYMAMRLVDQRPCPPAPVVCASSGRRLRGVDEGMLDCPIVGSPVSSIRTMTVGSGIRPDPPQHAGCGLRHGPPLGRMALPPVRNCTFPETWQHHLYATHTINGRFEGARL